MKKLFTLILTLIMVTSSAVFATPETINLYTMTKEELKDLIERAQDELFKFGVKEAGALLLEYKDIVVTFEGAEYGTFGLEFNLVIENNGKRDVTVSADKMYVNGWQVTPWIHAEVGSGKKNRTSITVYNAEDRAGVSSVGDLDNVEFVLKISNPDTYRTIYESGKITIGF